MAYLDSAATTFHKPRQVYEAVSRAMKTMSSPGRGGYPMASRATDKLFECREEAARLFDVKDTENIVFTMNATHGLNIAIKSIVNQGDKVLISGYEHNAVTRPLEAIGAQTEVVHSPLFDSDAAARAFSEKLDDSVKAVICTHVSNVFGFVLPVDQISQMCAEKGIPFILDASQSAGCLPVSMKELNAAFIAMPGHKGLYGPQGTGLLISGAETKTLIEGGTGSNSIMAQMPDFLPDRQEAGTHNVPGISGLCEGIRFVRSIGTESILRKERKLIDYAANSLINGNSRVKLWYGRDKKVQTGVLSLLINGQDCESTAEGLAKSGVAVRAGLHCAPEAHRSVGTIETGTVRVSTSYFSTKEDILELVRNINKLSIF